MYPNDDEVRAASTQIECARVRLETVFEGASATETNRLSDRVESDDETCRARLAWSNRVRVCACVGARERDSL